MTSIKQEGSQITFFIGKKSMPIVFNDHAAASRGFEQVLNLHRKLFDPTDHELHLSGVSLYSQASLHSTVVTELVPPYIVNNCLYFTSDIWTYFKTKCLFGNDETFLEISLFDKHDKMQVYRLMEPDSILITGFKST